MKKLLILLLIGMFVSCESTPGIEETNASVEKNTTNDGYSAKREKEKRFHIFYADWDQWGRTSRNCKGFGLCNFTSCWFCCTDEMDNIVPCGEQDEVLTPNAHRIKIDDDTKTGFLYIELDINDPVQRAAIHDGSLFYVDEDLTDENFKVHKGIYSIDKSVGSHGGYKIPVTQIRKE